VRLVILTSLLAGACGGCGNGDGNPGSSAGLPAAGEGRPIPMPTTDHVDLEAAQRAYIDLRFGMFIHFGILTFTGTWAQPNLPIEAFNPTALDPGQWADAALSAHMTYGVMTARHHDGFALWNSAVSDFDVGAIPWRDGQGDVVRAYVDAFRSRGLLPGLYYSVWDTTRGVGGSSYPGVADDATVTPEQLAYVKAQLTELLTNYGPIPILIFDGWSWKMGHRSVPYEEIRALVKSLQPGCLILDHTHLMSPWEADVAAIEEPKGFFAPADNTYPATQEQKIANGNDWFWGPLTTLQDPLSTQSIVDLHLRLLEPRWTNFLLNCPPNRQGLLDDNIVARLAQVGAAWSPDLTRPPLPAQGPQMEYPYQPSAASATSGVAGNAIDGLDNNARYTVWESEGDLPQSITIDLGQVKPDVGMLAYVPRYVNFSGPSADGAITSYAIAVSDDGDAFTEVAAGTWPADSKMKIAVFDPPQPARYVRLEARAANGTAAAATEITVGARR
jgi:alpha-L-fucosidase